MTRMTVRGLLTREGRQAVAVLESDEGDATLAFAIPTDEAHRLARALGLTPCPHSPICELVLGVVQRLAAAVGGVVIDGTEDGVVASLSLRSGGEELVLPCHPADALTLAVRAGAPIHATAAALALADAAPRPPAPEPSVRRWLDDVQPGDFAGAAGGE